MRPEQLPVAPGPQRCDRTVRGTSVGVPLLAVQLLRGFDGVDDTAAKVLLQQALMLKKEEEEEEKERKEKEMQDLLARLTAEYLRELSHSSSSSSPRKRKKRKKKKKLPKASSRSFCGRVRRRQWQWHSRFAGLPGDVLLRAVFPSVVVWPEMLGIMARFVPEGQHHARRQPWQWHVQCWFYWSRCTSRYVPFWRRQDQDAPHLGRYGPEGPLQWHLDGW